MPFRIVQSKQNARLKELRRALRNPGREAGGPIGIEGPHLLEEAVRAGLGIRCVFTSESHFNLESLNRSQDLRAPSSRFSTVARVGGHGPPPVNPAANPFDGELFRELEILLMPRDVLSSVLETETPQPVAALVEPPEWTWADVVASKLGYSLLVVLSGLQDPGNLGTIVRSAEAFGATGIVALPGTVSCWNQKAMRASAGSVFRLPVVQSGVDECFSRLREAGVRVLTTAARGATSAEAVDFTAPTALLIGNEGSGVPNEIAARADAAVTIPCPGPVESLNASVATGILLYEASRQRRNTPEARRSRS
jgi:TrmH family RNA methyltransferase